MVILPLCFDIIISLSIFKLNYYLRPKNGNPDGIPGIPGIFKPGNPPPPAPPGGDPNEYEELLLLLEKLELELDFPEKPKKIGQCPKCVFLQVSWLP
jgi:hypothetical protein